MATKDYRTNEATLLSFKRGDVIKLMEADCDEGKELLYMFIYSYISSLNHTFFFPFLVQLILLLYNFH